MSFLLVTCFENEGMKGPTKLTKQNCPTEIQSTMTMKYIIYIKPLRANLNKFTTSFVN